MLEGVDPKEYLGLMVEASEDAIIGATLEGRIVTWNAAAEETFGYPADEVRGRSIDVIIPDDRDGERESLLQRVSRGETVRRHRTVRRRRDGTSITVSLTLAPVRDDSEEIVGVFAVVRDITASERAEETLTFQAQLLDSVQESVVATDLDGRVLYWSKGAEALYGYGAEEVLGRDVTFIVPANARKEERERIRQVLETGSWRGRYMQLRKGGEPFWAETYISLVRDEAGEPCAIVGIDRDISAHRESRDALRESEERFRLAFEEGPLGMALVRKDQTILRANRALCDLLECAEKGLVGRTFTDLTHTDDVEEELEISRNLFRGQRSTATLEKRLYTKTRRLHWVRQTATVLRSDDGKPRYGLVMIEEITDHKRAQELIRRNERLASIGTFAAGIAHQINNPLGGILMAAQFGLASKDGPDGAEIMEQSLRDIEADAQRCGKIVRGVLGFARREPLEASPCRLSDVVHTAVSFTSKTSRPGKVIFEEPDPPEPMVSASPTELEQAVTNVIQNALESSDEKVTVEVEVEHDDDCGRITVRDDGDGIEERHRPFLFDPFYTTRREVGGTGLGLSLAHAVVTAHQGSIEIVSSPGKGTTVTIEIPLQETPGQRGATAR